MDPRSEPASAPALLFLLLCGSRSRFFSALFSFSVLFALVFFAAARIAAAAAAASSPCRCRGGNRGGESGRVNDAAFSSGSSISTPRHRRLGSPDRPVVLQVDHTARHLHLDVRLPFPHVLDVEVGG